MDHTSLLPGYRVLEPLGFGTLGRVYAAERDLDGSPVVLKVLHEDLASDPVLSARFALAVDKAMAVQHPNLVRLFDAPVREATHGLLPCFAMERCAGTALTEYLEAPLLSIDLACQIGVGICRGLAAAHAAGLVHADLKPSNVMVAWQRSGPPEVKVLDVGLSHQVFGTDDNLRWAAGTPRYLAPEVMLGKEADERSDVYSAAAILYELLGGSPVIDSDDDLEALKAAIGGRWRPLIEHNPHLPEPLVRAVEGGLHRDPAARLQSPDELRRQLLEYCAWPTSAAERSEDLERRSRSMPASTRLKQAPRPRPGVTPSTRELTSPVFPRSPPTPNIDPTGGAGPGDVETIDDLDRSVPAGVSAAPAKSELPVDLLVLGAGLGVGCALVWWGFLSS